MLAMAPNWQGLLDSAIPDSAIHEEEMRGFREHVRTGCPLGKAVFLGELERPAGRILRPQKAGRPLKLLKHP
jgi:hypothetical protein